MGRGPGPWAAACRGYVPILPNLRSPVEGGGPQPALKLARQAHSATRPGSSLPCCVLCLRPGRGLPPGRRRSTSAPAGKPGTGRDRKATPLQADGSGPCRSAASRAGVPISVTAAALWDQPQSVWGAQKQAPRHSGRARPPRSATPAGRQVHHQQAGRFPAARRNFQWGSGPPEPLRARSADRDQCAPALARAVPCRYVMGLNPNPLPLC